MPPARSSRTRPGLNWDQQLSPSRLLTISVETPAVRARAIIAGTLPPSDFARYQIHIERPCMGLTDALAVAGEDQARTTSTSAIRSEEAAVVAFLGRPNDKCSPCDAC